MGVAFPRHHYCPTSPARPGVPFTNAGYSRSSDIYFAFANTVLILCSSTTRRIHEFLGYLTTTTSHNVRLHGSHLMHSGDKALSTWLASHGDCRRPRSPRNLFRRLSTSPRSCCSRVRLLTSSSFNSSAASWPASQLLADAGASGEKRFPKSPL